MNTPESLIEKLEHRYADEPIGEAMVLLIKQNQDAARKSPWKTAALYLIALTALSLAANVTQALSAKSDQAAQQQATAAAARLTAAATQLEALSNQAAGVARTVEDINTRLAANADAVSAGATALGVQLRNVTAEAARLEDGLKRANAEMKKPSP